MRNNNQTSTANKMNLSTMTNSIKMKRYIKSSILLIALTCVSFFSFGQTQVLFQDFSTTSGWSSSSSSITFSANGGGSNMLTWTSSGTNGFGSAYRTITAVSPFSTTLGSSTGGLVIWYINFRYSDAGLPNGCTSGTNGLAAVFASSAGLTSATVGNRYAIMYG